VVVGLNTSAMHRRPSNIVGKRFFFRQRVEINDALLNII